MRKKTGKTMSRNLFEKYNSEFQHVNSYSIERDVKEPGDVGKQNSLVVKILWDLVMVKRRHDTWNRLSPIQILTRLNPA